MKRKPGALLSIEVSILASGLSLLRSGDGEFYGYAIAKEIQEEMGASQLTAHGTLYRALERLVTAGLLTSRWEDPADAAIEKRPVRRLYRVTATGERALQDLPAPVEQKARRVAKRAVTS